MKRDRNGWGWFGKERAAEFESRNNSSGLSLGHSWRQNRLAWLSTPISPQHLLLPRSYKNVLSFDAVISRDYRGRLVGVDAYTVCYLENRSCRLELQTYTRHRFLSV
jgi:hypothetical protein